MKVFLTDRAKKQYKSLSNSEQTKIEKKLMSLMDSPLLGKKLLGEFKGTRSIRAWPYRIIYLIKERQQEIWVVSILHRQGAYK